MIITCPNCKKKFQIDATLVPKEGRDLQCGSCNHVWFYKIEDTNSSPLTLNEDFINKKAEENSTEKKIEKISENKDLINKDKPKNKKKYN